MLAVLAQTPVCADVLHLAFLAVPIIGIAIDARGKHHLLAVYGDSAPDGGCAVSLYLAAVDIIKLLECAAHDDSFLNGYDCLS